MSENFLPGDLVVRCGSPNNNTKIGDLGLLITPIERDPYFWRVLVTNKLVVWTAWNFEKV
jgi:hypothetical protein